MQIADHQQVSADDPMEYLLQCHFTCTFLVVVATLPPVSVTHMRTVKVPDVG